MSVMITVAAPRVPDGDPDLLRVAAGRFSAGADAMRREAAHIEQVMATTADVSWLGFAASSFKAACAVASADAKVAADAFGQAAVALATLASELQAAQDEARQAVAVAADVNARSTRAGQAYSDAIVADIRASHIAAAGGPAAPPSQAERLLATLDVLAAEAAGVQRSAAAAQERAAAAARRAAAAFDHVAAMTSSARRAPAPQPQAAGGEPGVLERLRGLKGAVWRGYVDSRRALLNGFVAGDFNRQGYQDPVREFHRVAGQFLSGLIVVGDLRDAAAAGLRLADTGGKEGKLDLGVSIFGMVPVAGDVAKGIKGGKRVVDVVEDTAGVGHTIGLLRDAAQGKGNFSLGSATRAEADALGREWVGEGYTVASDGKTLLSEDGLRQYRPPAYKPGQGKTQANFEQRPPGIKQWQSNGHLDIED
jgi:hypothetical protein